MAGLAAEHQQGTFGGIALDLPLPVIVEAHARVVAQHTGANRQLQGRGLGDVDGLPIGADVAQRRVADAADIEYLAGADHSLHGHFVAGQGPGLVRADHRHRAEGFHRRQTADDRLPLRHALHAEGEGDGHERRQALGDRRGHQGDHHHEHVLRRFAAPEGAEQEGHGADGEDGDGQHAPEAVDLLQQRSGRLVDAAEHAVDLAQFGIGPGAHHHPAGLPVDHQGAGVGHAVAVAERRVEGDRLGGLLHRQRFAGQGGFLDAQFLHRQQAQIRRHPVAGGEQDEVAGHQFAGVDLLALAVADHRGDWRKHPADGLQRRFGLAFLDETDDRVDQYRGEQHAGVHPVAEHGGDHGCGHHHVEQDVVELQQQAP
ncbi:hypothetical protein D3C81_848430 [compost metagenome]